MGESFKVGNKIYKMTSKGIKCGDMLYTGNNVEKIIQDFNVPYYDWTFDSNWKIENGTLIAYTEEDGGERILFKIGGLNITDASTITNEQIFLIQFRVLLAS